MAVGNSQVTFLLKDFNTGEALPNADVYSERWQGTETNPVIGAAVRIKATSDINGLVTFNLSRFDTPLDYCITLPDTRFFILPVLTGDVTIDLGTRTVSKSPVAFEERDLTAEVSQYRTTAALALKQAKFYNSYVALLSQSGASAPTATVLQNELSAAIVWARTGVGVYTGTLVAAFTVNKTYAPTQIIIADGGGGDYGNSGFAILSRTSANVITLQTKNRGLTGASEDAQIKVGDAADNLLVATTIEIRVYN